MKKNKVVIVKRPKEKQKKINIMFEGITKKDLINAFKNKTR